MLDGIIITLYMVLLVSLFIFWRRSITRFEEITQPIRDVMLDIVGLEQHAKEVALTHTITNEPTLSDKLLKRIEQDSLVLMRSYKYTNKQLKNEKFLVPAAEWLLDNFYVIEDQIRAIQNNLPSSYYRELPVLNSGVLKGYPRVYAIVREMVAHTDGLINQSLLLRFIKAYQEEAILTIGELWAVGIMLRAALIEDIRYISDYIVRTQSKKDRADKWINGFWKGIKETDDIQKSFEEYAKKNKVKLDTSFVERLLQQLRERGPETAPIIRWLDKKLGAQDRDAESIIKLEHQQQTSAKVSIENAITSLRFISSLEWAEVFEDLSKVEKILCQDPDATYADMDFETRDYYRDAVEKISKAFNVSESLVANKAVKCAEKSKERGCNNRRYMHVGYYLVDKGKGMLFSELGFKEGTIQKIQRFFAMHADKIYISSILLLTIFIVLMFVRYAILLMPLPSLAMLVIVALAIIIPASDIAAKLTNWLITRIYEPCFIPKLELKEGISHTLSTTVVIPTLLTNEKRVDELIRQIEVYYLANQEENLYFALLGDYVDADQQDSPKDQDIITAAINGINSLNQKYSRDKHDIFFLFHRYRKWNAKQNTWMGWERKRGKLIEFNSFLRGDENTSFSVVIGDMSVIKKTKYIITLDADTQLPRDGAKSLIGAMAHPLNQPILNDNSTVVLDGYGVLQPRICISVTIANKSIFSSVFSGETGVDAYTTAVSDVYQDVFCEGIYTGKGIYDVDIFNTVLKDAIPENTVLSHDLLEGSYIRTGLITDIQLVDGYPSRFNSYAMRLHRWVRGDWQLLPWIFGTVKNIAGEKVQNPLSLLSKWKIIDNLRRSLIQPGVLLLLILGISILPGSYIIWTGFALLALLFPLITGIFGSILIPRGNIGLLRELFFIILNLKNLIVEVGLSLVFLPYKSYLMVDAIVKTISRVFITKKNMLEWETAADVEKRLKGNYICFQKMMWSSQIITVLILAMLIYLLPNSIFISSGFFVIWIFSPFIAYRISKPVERKITDLTPKQKEKMRMLARKTWRYFEDFVGDEDNWLPPDNYQENPPVGVAHRTSPTNVGLLIIAAVTARDMGYIGIVEMIKRIENTIITMGKLEKWGGHYYNWYDTVSLKPLKPLYVSTVDSGNLLGYLLTLKHGLLEYMDKPIIDINLAYGIKDTISVMIEEFQNSEQDISFLMTDIKVMEEQVEDYIINGDVRPERWYALLCKLSSNPIFTDYNALTDTLYWGKRFKTMIKSFSEELNQMIPWIRVWNGMADMLINSANLSDDLLSSINRIINTLEYDFSLCKFAGVYHEFNNIIQQIIDEIEQNEEKGEETLLLEIKGLKSCLYDSYLSVNDYIEKSESLIKEIQKIVYETDFKQLFNEKRQLFSIGFNVEKNRLTDSYYDLLASEARQASIIAIAKGDVTQKHWFRLGRTLTMIENLRVLLSWSGTMFEYLMPLLIMKNYKNTLMDETYISVVKAQMIYGKQRKVPWGISESAYNAFDINLNYQYRAFGIPQLGLKRGLIDDVVVAPYACVLGMLIEPAAAYKNIMSLIKEGLYSSYGMYEAVDYTPRRLPKGKGKEIIMNYMVHHQGMIFLALNNYLNSNILQERFHSEPIIKATELLLQEKVPDKQVVTKQFEEAIVDVNKMRNLDAPIKRTYETANTNAPETHLISNGKYSIMLTNSGSGYSKIEKDLVSRWREDSIQDNWGMYFYIQNLNSNKVWSATYHPYLSKPDKYKVDFYSDKAEYYRTDGSIETHSEITVSPEKNIEVRRMSLTNNNKHPRVFNITSYFEVVLSSLDADMAHPVFNNLFVQTEYVGEHQLLLATRRPRTTEERQRWLVHTYVLEGESVGGIQYETDRARFIGRGRTKSNAIVVEPNHPLSNTVGSVLEPIMSIRVRVRIASRKKARITFVTGVADSREEAIALGREFGDKRSVVRAFDMAWTHNQVELKYLNISTNQASLYQRMGSSIIYRNPSIRKREDIIKCNNKGQSGLWAYGISGDIPIVIVKINRTKDINLVYNTLAAHEYWRLKGLQVDLVLINEYEGSYIQSLQEMLSSTIHASHARDRQNKPGGVFLLKASVMTEEDLCLFMTAARLVFDSHGSIKTQLSNNILEPKSLPVLLKPNRILLPSGYNEEWEPRKQELSYYNGYGGFSKDANEYVIIIDNFDYIPAPWINVLANQEFGCLISASGFSYTWAENSRENKITPWYNDTVSELSGEVIYIRDEDTGDYWSITPLPIREKHIYKIRHGQGYSIFESYSRGIKQDLLVFVSTEDPIKVYNLTLKNNTSITRKLSATFYTELILGVNSHETAQYIITDTDNESGAFIARNLYNEHFSNRITFIDSSERDKTYTGDRREFIGRNRSNRQPAGLRRINLSGRTGAGYEPCGAIQIKINLKPGEKKEFAFFMGQGRDINQVRSMVEEYREMDNIKKSYIKVKEYWHQQLNVIQVQTPDLAADLMLNKWLMYQTLASRLWARSGFYQAGGAFGFRDQLQDVLSLIYSKPDLVKKHIIYSASHQFLEGDVQHWWHPIINKGIRTKISDDLLWLPYVVADYIKSTGDFEILEQSAHYLEDIPLEMDEDERYNTPVISEETGDIYEHCIKAIDWASKFGKHGLPLIGTGDWNDGMNTIGNEGRGESVWLGWFLYKVIKNFIFICQYKNDVDRVNKYMKTAETLLGAIEKHGWDGGWYRRAYFDDGTPLGSEHNVECQIDSISQSWAVISGGADDKRIKKAMDAFEHYLVQRDEGLIMLLTPPFDKSDLEPGYIKGYMPGVRENGGQYTHAAVWAVLAYAKMGDGDKAWQLYNMINPINHSLTYTEAGRYKVEPYVMAADVYTVPPHTGRGGWTWYTGSSSWMYRVGIEWILGLRLLGDRLIIDPCIPKNWEGYSMKYKYKNTTYDITVKNPNKVNTNVASVAFDSQVITDKYIPLSDDGQVHNVLVILGNSN